MKDMGRPKTKPDIVRRPTRGRPPLPEDKLQLVWSRISPGALRTLDQTAETAGRKLSSLTRYLLERALEGGFHLEFIREQQLAQLAAAGVPRSNGKPGSNYLQFQNNRQRNRQTWRSL